MRYAVANEYTELAFCSVTIQMYIQIINK